MPTRAAQALRTGKCDGRDLTLSELLGYCRELTQQGMIPTLEPILPAVFRLRGEPYTLREHFPFSPMFNLHLPERLLYKTARQVSKSTTVAASSILQCNSIPYFSTLFVTPLFEQIRRFSSLYIKPFIETSPIKGLWSDITTENSVLQRTFKNHARMTFSFAFLDADRTRGISCDLLCVDESIRMGTRIPTARGAVPVELVLPGDRVLAASETGGVQEDEVVACADHGVRDCYRVEFASGDAIEATSDSFLATTAGWKRLEAVIGEVYAACIDGGTDATPAGDIAGGRQSNWPAVQQSAWLGPACLQLPQVPGVVRVRTYATQAAEESRLRQLVERLDDADLSCFTAYCGVVLSRRAQASDLGLAATTDLGGGCLVVPGRRESPGQCDGLSYPRLQCRGGAPTGLVVDTTWCLGQSEELHKRQQDLLDHSCASGQRSPLGGQTRSVCRPGNAVQASNRAAGTHADVLLVRNGLHSFQESWPVHYPAIPCGTSVLPCSQLPLESPQCTKPEVLRYTGATCGAQQQELRTVSGESSRSAEVRSRIRSPLAPGASGEIPGGQASPSPEADRRATSTQLDVSTLWVDGATRDQIVTDAILPGLSQTGDTGNSGAICFAPSPITRITWTGTHRVYDLETKHRHNFVAGGVLVHNCQDLNKDHIPIIAETQSASKYKIMRFTGTPKTLDNTIEGLWGASSQAEWFTHCKACGYWNIAAAEYDLLAMIGPWHEQISERIPGVVCAKCRRPIHPRHHGRWVHRFAERKYKNAGYHVPQVIMPMHYARAREWGMLLAKQQGAGNTSPARFFNEVLGESYDTGSKLISETELKHAACLPWKNSPLRPGPEVLRRLKGYEDLALGIDWGGGGETQVSFTTVALLGLTSGGKIDVLWGRRLLTPNDHVREAVEIYNYFKLFNPRLLAHDFTGAGDLRETVLVQAGVPANRVFRISYIGPAKHSLIQYIKPTLHQQREHHRLDKPRSLLTTIGAIRLGQIRFFQYDYVSDDEAGLLRDFLALIQEKVEARTAGDMYLIQRAEGFSDDFAHAVNLGAICLWQSHNAWPDFGALACAMPYTGQQIEQFAPEAPDWFATEQDDYFMTP